MAMTTSSSINVNPFFTCIESKLSGLKCKNYLTGSSKKPRPWQGLGMEVREYFVPDFSKGKVLADGPS